MTQPADARISAQMIKALREATGAGVMDCKRALQESHGDFERAKAWLVRKGLDRATAKADREVKQGLVYAYIHHNHQLGVLLELNSESDFVARNEEFRRLGHELALQVAGADPKWVRREDVPQLVLDRERASIEADARDQKKPEAVVAKIVNGKLNDFYKREVLMEQAWTKDDKKSVEHLVKEAIAKLGENITVSRFVRYKVGEAPPSSP